MQHFQTDGTVAKLVVICDGCRVTVTVERQDGTKLTEQDAEVVLTEAAQSFPQRIRS